MPPDTALPESKNMKKLGSDDLHCCIWESEELPEKNAEIVQIRAIMIWRRRVQ